MSALHTLVAQPPPLRTDADGVARVGGTRVRLETVVTAFNNGCGAEEIVLKYPSLDLKDVYCPGASPSHDRRRAATRRSRPRRRNPPPRHPCQPRTDFLAPKGAGPAVVIP
jgi:hypothetical protein